ncbi:MAG: hypothetical protein CMH26_04085 [Micavibrio sp.]|mgnify:CR=1 FL=1|nr:hypothetical protein [Micavibrio sp.]
MGVDEKKNPIRFGKVFGEVLWATLKVGFIAALITSAHLSYVLLSSDKAPLENVFEALIAIAAMTFIGFLLFAPAFILVALFIISPICLMLLKKGFHDVRIFVFAGASVNFVLMKLILLQDTEVFLQSFTSLSGLMDIIYGALTGFLFYKSFERYLEPTELNHRLSQS